MALFLFDTIINIIGSGATNQELSLPLGRTTLVNWTSASSLTYIGLTVPNGLIDGMLVVFSNITNGGGFTQNFAHESILETTAAFRFINAGQNTVNGGSSVGAVEYRYNSTISRWVQISKTS